jgi:hypothetical protein
MRMPLAFVPVVMVLMSVPAARRIFVTATLVDVAPAPPNISVTVPLMVAADPDIPAARGSPLLDRGWRSIARTIMNNHDRSRRDRRGGQKQHQPQDPVFPT